MRPALFLEPGARLVASAVFLTRGPLFVSVAGPAAITFSSLWAPSTKAIENPTDDLWQLWVHASRLGPIGYEVRVWVISESNTVTLIGAGNDESSPEALLTCAIRPWSAIGYTRARAGNQL